MITRPKTVAEAVCPDDDTDIIYIGEQLDPMEEFARHAQTEFDRLMRTDSAFRRFINRHQPVLALIRRRD